ncbi:MAG TPA: nuclear transport factor 2 family protein [Acidimicrobiales bacterium]|nr:nuclear transport factor 2 family protein [Acidimicrobiales bacterium]
MIDSASVQNLIAGWWFDYDQGNFAAWPAYFTTDARFTCQSDSGKTDFEEFVTADVAGRRALLAWQEDHRRHSPYPLRHNGTNIHVASSDGSEARFRSYIFVTQIVDGSVSNLSSGLCLGTVREEDGALRIAELRIILDFTDSALFGEAGVDSRRVE